MSSTLEREVENAISRLVDLDYFAKQPIENSTGEVVGYNCHVVLKSGEVASSGTSWSWALSKRIAIAELLERLSMKVAASISDSTDLYLLKKVPSSSGFAAGFDSDKTRLRAIAEGLERWAWSQWIDFKFELPKVTGANFSPLAAHLKSQFTNVHFFSKSFEIRLDEGPLKFRLGIVLGENGNGVFAGSRMTSADSDLWTHALIEAARNYHNFCIWRSRSELALSNDWYSNRVKFFGTNRDLALDTLDQAQNSEWPVPKIELLTQIPSIVPNHVHVWRCLFHDFIPWHEGPVERFVY